MVIATTLSIGCAKTKVAPDETFDIYGWLKRLDTGVGVGYKRIRLYKKEPAQAAFSFWYELGNYPNGFYVFSYLRFTKVGVYEFYTEFLGDAEYGPSKSSTLKVEVYVPAGIATALSITVDRTTAKVGETVRVSGKLTRVDTGAAVPYKGIRLYWKPPAATEFTWHGTTSTDGNGNYWFDPYLEWEGKYSFYAEFLGDETYAGCEV